MLAISTAWNSKTRPNTKEMLLEIRDAGFGAIEISHHFTAERLEEIANLIDIFDFKVVSVHNFCPLPPKPQLNRGTSDYYRLSSLNEEERKTAVEYTKKSIDTAKRLSVEAVVIHAGTVELNENYGGMLIDLFNESEANSEYYNELKQKFLKVRETEKGSYLEAVTKSLKEILSYALETDIKIGLETRYYPEEIPNFEEIEYFLNLFSNKGLFYWHDVGHAEANERLGITAHSVFLQKFSEYMLGIHLHDIRGLEDHIAPFRGEFDFSRITPYLSDKVIKVIEVNSQVTSQDIKMALNKLEAVV